MALLASAISNVAHLAAFDDMVKARFESLDLSPLLMYMVDTCHPDALYWLASQFDVLGWKGWNLAQTEADRRALIKKAIELHRYKGTIWAIKEAVKSVGFTDCKVKEHIGLTYDGSAFYDGAFTYSGGDWWTFLVKVGLNDGVTVDAAMIDLLTRLINEYKNVRSVLVGVSFMLSFVEDITPVDTIDLTIITNGTPVNEQF